MNFPKKAFLPEKKDFVPDELQISGGSHLLLSISETPKGLKMVSDCLQLSYITHLNEKVC